MLNIEKHLFFLNLLYIFAKIITKYQTMMKNTMILTLFLACTCCKVQAQTIVYNYNTQGGCTSRVYSSKSSPKARSAQKSTTDSKLINFEVS